jgi:hypothetical protein
MVEQNFIMINIDHKEKRRTTKNNHSRMELKIKKNNHLKLFIQQK